jgi:hypothetical protein
LIAARHNGAAASSRGASEESLAEDFAQAGLPEASGSDQVSFCRDNEINSTPLCKTLLNKTAPPWRALETTLRLSQPWLISLDFHNVLDVGPNCSIPCEFDPWIGELLREEQREIIVTSYIGTHNQRLREHTARIMLEWNARLRETLPRNCHWKLPVRLFIVDSKCSSSGKCDFLHGMVFGRTQDVVHIDDCPEICQECEDWGMNVLRIAGPNPQRQHPASDLVFADLPSSLKYLLKCLGIAPQCQAHGSHSD